ncbi:unnamed protein product [Rhizophagus irregularis]|nr:unnamed protein product [Rhizophagus irregularis]
MGNFKEEPIKGTPLKYQQLYQKCWDDEPKLRPDIEEVYKILNKDHSYPYPRYIPVPLDQQDPYPPYIQDYSYPYPQSYTDL